MAFWITSAPDDYDYSYTKTVQEIGAVTGERGKWRVVESNDTEGRFENYQLPRYQSGMHATYPANGPDAKRMGITISTGSGRSGVSGVSKQKTTKTTLDLSMIEVVNVSDAVAWGRAIIEELKDADVVMLDTDGIAGNERTWGEMVSYLGRRNVTVKYDHDDGYPHATDASRRGVSGVSKQKTTITLSTRYSDRTTTIPANVTADRIAWVSRTTLRNAERRLRMIGGDYLRAHTADGTQVDMHIETTLHPIKFSGAVSSRTASDAEMRRTAEQAKNANYAATNAAMKIENKYGPSEKNGWKKQKMPPAEAAKLKKLLALQSAAMTVLKALPEKYRGDYGLRFF